LGLALLLRVLKEKNLFRETLYKLDKKVLLFEGGKSLNINPVITRTGISGALRVMQELGIRSFQKELSSLIPKPDTLFLVEDSTWIRAKFSGLFHPTVQLGQYVKVGDSLGSVSDPFGNFDKIQKSNFSGHVICVNQSPIVNQGDAIIHITKNETELP